MKSAGNALLVWMSLTFAAARKIGSVYPDQVVAINNAQYAGFVEIKKIHQLALRHVEVFI